MAMEYSQITMSMNKGVIDALVSTNNSTHNQHISADYLLLIE